MITRLLRFGRWIADAREWLILLAIAAAAAWFYFDARRWQHWGDQVCAFAGTNTAAATVATMTDKGERLVAKGRGQLCAEAVQDLASFKARTIAASADALGSAQVERDRKGTADIAAANSNAADRQRANKNMEELDAQVGDDDRVDGNWFAGINELGGLR